MPVQGHSAQGLYHFLLIFFRATSQYCLNCDSTAMVTYSLTSFVFPQFTSFHSLFHSFHGLMNSINWPASIVWVFIAQLVEHCSANAEATDSLKPRKTFFRDTSQLRKLRFNCDGHIFISDFFFLLTRHVHYREDKEVIINTVYWPYVVVFSLFLCLFLLSLS